MAGSRPSLGPSPVDGPGPYITFDRNPSITTATRPFLLSDQLSMAAGGPYSTLGSGMWKCALKAAVGAPPPDATCMRSMLHLYMPLSCGYAPRWRTVAATVPSSALDHMGALCACDHMPGRPCDLARHMPAPGLLPTAHSELSGGASAAVSAGGAEPLRLQTTR